MAQESETVAGATIELLEARLRRVAYLLSGATDWTGVPIPPEKPSSHEESVSRRVGYLERELAKLSRNVPAVRDVIQLRTSSNPPCEGLQFNLMNNHPLWIHILHSFNDTISLIIPLNIQMTNFPISSNHRRPKMSLKASPAAPSPLSFYPTRPHSLKQPPV